MKQSIVVLLIFVSHMGHSQDTVAVNGIPAALEEIKRGNFVSIGLFDDPSTVFPSEFFIIPREKVIGLILDNCAYTTLPARLNEFTNIMYFRYSWFLFSDCPLASFPSFLTSSSQLRVMSIEGANFTSIPSLKTLSKLESLKLYMCNLPDFPREVLDLPSITDLNLSCNKFTTIPDDIDRLRNLKVLEFEGGACGATPISVVPSSIGNLSELEVFSLGYTDNPIKELPNSFYELSNLISFECNGCGLTSLNEDLGNFQNLEYLSLSNLNYFQQFPEALFTLPNLRSFRFYQYSKTADAGLLGQEERINEWGKSLEDFNFMINIPGR